MEFNSGFKGLIRKCRCDIAVHPFRGSAHSYNIRIIW